AGERALEDLKGLAQRIELGFAGVLGEQLTGQALELLAYLVDALRLLRRQSRDHRATVGDDQNQTFGFQLAQGFSYQRAADAGHFAELALGQPLAGAKATDQNSIANVFGHAVSQYGCNALDLEIVLGLF